LSTTHRLRLNDASIKLFLGLTEEPIEWEKLFLTLEIKLNDKWIRLDCSNDSELPSYIIWDGKSNCDIAVKYTKIYTPEESKKLENEEKEEFNNDFNKYKEFFLLMNEFLQKLRRK
ncbi:MAG: hypothetical protein ACQESE_03460, partial [Nanobdellota archaeon]